MHLIEITTDVSARIGKHMANICLSWEFKRTKPCDFMERRKQYQKAETFFSIFR